MKALRPLAVLALLLAVPRLGICACDPVLDSSRIAVAGGSITEVLYFIEAQDRIVAVDTTSTFPKEAQAFPSVGYVRGLSTEGLLSLRPSLVIGEEDMGPPEVVKQIDMAGVPVIKIPETPTSEGILQKIRCVAKILDMSSKAESLIAEKLSPMVAQLNQVRSGASSSPAAALILDAHSGSLMSAGNTTSGHGFLEMTGAENVFADFSGWKPVTSEAILSSNPDFIVVSLLSAESRQPPVIPLQGSRIDSQVIAMDATAILGFGPRTIQAALELAQTFHASSDLAPGYRD